MEHLGTIHAIGRILKHLGTICDIGRTLEHLGTIFAIGKILEHYLIYDADLLSFSVPGHAAHHALVPVVDHLLVPRALQHIMLRVARDFPC